MTAENIVVVPMAGLGDRFKRAGYIKPKPFIDVNGKKMINIVLDDIVPRDCEEVILISLKESNCREEIKDISLKNRNTCINIIELETLTAGSLQTILAAENKITGKGLILSNCDQKVDIDIDDFIKTCSLYDGGLVTFESQNPHHSYVDVSDNIITNIIEKEVISNKAVTGIYYIKDGAEFINAAKSVIKFNKKEKGEFYVSSALQLLIYKGLKLVAYDARSYMLGTPEELKSYLANNINE